MQLKIELLLFSSTIQDNTFEQYTIIYYKIYSLAIITQQKFTGVNLYARHKIIFEKQVFIVLPLSTKFSDLLEVIEITSPNKTSELFFDQQQNIISKLTLSSPTFCQEDIYSYYLYLLEDIYSYYLYLYGIRFNQDAINSPSTTIKTFRKTLYYTLFIVFHCLLSNVFSKTFLPQLNTTQEIVITKIGECYNVRMIVNIFQILG
eukprot:TRINITY_DN23380_c0_g1_i2.p3 TRINITY_DN23380_c0_g1~~TRINITY_DN23380_c0_g1_i2.p3  ORF type:complete len:204 (-),score=-19.36 TRINITY_DN23380_c0_g1_i2:494-1105(-)